MLHTLTRKVKNKYPFTSTIVLLILVVYTMYSLKKDIDIYIGDSNIEIAVEDFQFEHSICNPSVIKDILFKANQTGNTSVSDTKRKGDNQNTVVPPSEIAPKQSSPDVRPSRFSQKVAGEIMTLQNRKKYMIESQAQKWKKTHQNITRLMKTEQATFDQHQKGRPFSTTLHQVSGKNRSQEFNKETVKRNVSSFHLQTRKQITKDEQRRLILNAQAQSTGTEELYVNVVRNKTKPDLYDRKNITIETKFSKTSLRPRPTPTGSQPERTMVPFTGKKRGRISSSHVGHSMSRLNYMSSPYYLDSFHPMYIDLVKLVRDKIERGVKFPVDPINTQKVDYIYKPKDCKFKASEYNVSLLVIVRSDAQHLDMRSVIRSTWGNVSLYFNIKLVFAIGVDLHTETYIHEEFKLHRDILQGSFIDDSHSGTNKTIMALTWSNGSCPDADAILLTEEDHLVKLTHILEYIRTFNQTKMENLFAGFLINRSEVQRVTDSPWSVKWTDFPRKFWPPYLRKGCMLISRKVVRKLTEAFPYVKFIHVYDTYLGIVAKKLLLNLKNDVRFFQTADNLLTKSNHFAFSGFDSPLFLNASWYDLTQKQKI